MSAPRPWEADLLVDANAALEAVSAPFPQPCFEVRLQALEACAARFGGFDLADYHKSFEIRSLCKPGKLVDLVAPIASAIEATPIHPALALSALARESLVESARKSTGAYHTDFRLARRLAELAAPHVNHQSKVIDPACGAGILLVALTIAVCGRDRAKTSEWLSRGVCAADKSENSLRGALLSLASLTDDVPALVKMRSRWFSGDSLLADPSVWDGMAPGGFQAVIGNPPWEKVKLTRHEFLKSSGATRHYGAETNGLDERRFNAQRDEIATYSRRLLERYPDLGRGEPDLYVAFTELFSSLCRSGGVVAALVPGGLIRSQGTEAVRFRLFDAAQSVSVSIIDNRARFFEIDTRFKFLAIALLKAGATTGKRGPISILHEKGIADGLVVTGSATIGRSSLWAVRKDMSLPEVRSLIEWKILQRMSRAGCPWDEPQSGWAPEFCREVDMTKERPHFLPTKSSTALPVVEGRMVHQHRFGVKGHALGTGRRAVWEPFPIGASELRSQFWIETDRVPSVALRRVAKLRAGFCDIAGQTNERSLMAALIPPGVVCGNKVPTILFPEDPSEDRLLVWVAIANSIAFDWMLRRVMTTTVNYFLLQSIPLPRLAKGGLPWQRLVSCAKSLRELDRAGASPSTRERMAQLRADIDAEVAISYGLGIEDLLVIIEDFPILDRGQPSLAGESKSTITRDTLLAAAAKRLGHRGTEWQVRVRNARELGAEAYIPSEVAAVGVCDTIDEGAVVHV